MKHNGLSMADFDDQKSALEAAEDLIKQNMQEFEHAGDRVEHKNPLLVKVWYVLGHGKTRKISQVEEKVMSASADAKAGRKALDETGCFIEGLGVGMLPSGAASSGSQTKLESVAFVAMTSSRDALKAMTNRLKTELSSFKELEVKLSVKAKSEPLYSKYEKEVVIIFDTLGKFITSCLVALEESGTYKESDDDDKLQDAAVKLEGLLKTGECHEGGAKLAKKRLANL